MKNALQTAITQAQSHTDRDDDNGYHNSDYSDNSSDDDSNVSDNGLPVIAAVMMTITKSLVHFNRNQNQIPDNNKFQQTFDS